MGQASPKQLKIQGASFTHSIKRDVPLKKELKEKQQTKGTAATHSAWSSAPFDGVWSLQRATPSAELLGGQWGRSQDPHFHELLLSSGRLVVCRGRKQPAQRPCKQAQADRKHPWSECL